MDFQKSGKRYLLFTSGISYNHTFLVTKNGRIAALGNNSEGQLFRNTHYSYDIIKKEITNECNLLPKYLKIKKISLGNYHTIVLDCNNIVYSSGGNDFGQLSLGISSKNGSGKVKCLCKEKIIDIACGSNHSIFLSTTSVFGSGDNRGNQISGNEGKKKYLSAIKIKTNEEVMEACGCGCSYTCLLSRKKELFMIGSVFKKAKSSVLKKIKLNEKVKQFTCGFSSIFVLGSSGKVFGFGGNEYQELQQIDGSVSEMKEMKGYSNKNIVSIKSGGFHNVILTSSGHAFGVGYQKAIGKMVDFPNLEYKPILLKKNIVQVECAGDGTFLFDNNGDIWVAGNNSNGQLGLENGCKDVEGEWKKSKLSRKIRFEIIKNNESNFPFMKKIMRMSLLVDIIIIYQ